MSGDLCQKAPACSYNGNGNDRKFLYRRVREAPDYRHGVPAERFFIKGHQGVHCGDPVAPLGEPGGKDHVLLGLLYRLAVQYFYFNPVDWYVPPLQ